MSASFQLAQVLDKTAPPKSLAPKKVSLSCKLKSAPNLTVLKILRTKGRGGEGGGIFLRARLSAVLLLAAPFAAAQIHSSQINKKEKPQREDVEWIWQYTPSDSDKLGRENELVQDLHFRPFLEQFLTAPQTFWGTPIDGRPRSLATTALDYLSVPGKVLADENRYVSISGCVVHFCPARGLLWLDLNGTRHLVVFAALDWIKQGKPTTDPGAEYTLWVFPNQPLSIVSGAAQHPPPALIKSIARWSAEPLAGSNIVQNITHAILVDPDGTPHEVDPSTLGITSPNASQPRTEAAPALKPRE